MCGPLTWRSRRSGSVRNRNAPLVVPTSTRISPGWTLSCCKVISHPRWLVSVASMIARRPDICPGAAGRGRSAPPVPAIARAQDHAAVDSLIALDHIGDIEAVEDPPAAGLGV